jgi:hypothetical protein
MLSGASVESIAMPAWELQDVKLGPGGRPPDTAIVKIVYAPTSPAEAQKDALARMRLHYYDKSSVDGVVIFDERGVQQARVTAFDVMQAPRRAATDTEKGDA